MVIIINYNNELLVVAAKLVAPPIMETRLIVKLCLQHSLLHSSC